MLHNSYAQNPSAAKLAKANAQLSNLVAPTAVNITLAPGIADSLSLGSKAFKWKNLNIDNVVFADKSIQTTAFKPYTAGTGISISGTTITNTAPDKTVVLNNGTGISITGTYPNFTITNTGSSGGGTWSLTGNAGTTPGTNFIGTTDAKSLVFKVNNTQAGLIDYSTYNTGTRNTAFGEIALYSNTSGIENTATGYGTLYSNTTGNDNSALGKYALFTNNQGSYNTALGYNAMFFNTTGVNNTATGSLALQNNTTGYNNTADGYSALYSNNGGNGNTAIGSSALYSNTSGTNNTATGGNALQSNSGGSENVADGYGALQNATGSYNTGTGSFSLYASTGNNNTANGFEALFANTTGINNTALGNSSLWANTTGNTNTSVGNKALFNNASGRDNIALGAAALFSNTTGIYNLAIGDSSLLNFVPDFSPNSWTIPDIGIGTFTLYNNTTGFGNIACGYSALAGNITGTDNLKIGNSLFYAGIDENQTGSNNTFVGNEYRFAEIGGAYIPYVGTLSAPINYGGYPNGNVNYNTGFGSSALGPLNGDGNTGIGFLAGNSDAVFDLPTTKPDYHYCTYVGYSTYSSLSSETNSTAIGNAAIVDASNKVRIGNTSITSIGGQVGWTTFSDGRFKENIKEDVKGLEFINLLKPITYTVNVQGLNAYYEKNRRHDIAYDKMKSFMNGSEVEASKIIYNGFIAQDVEDAANKLSYNFSGVDKPKTKDGLYGLRYADFVVPLVKAVQELSTQNDSLKSIVAPLQATVTSLQQQLNQLKTMVLSMQQCSPCNAGTQSITNNYAVITDEASLEQNIPNPFSSSTTIRYTLPQKYTSAAIIVTDKTGKKLKTISVSGNGKGTLNVDASTLSSGAYSYSLLIDGKLISTKQMVLAK